jgi:hypothetical protein
MATDEANILAGYSADAEDLIPRFEALRTEDVLAPVMEMLPAGAGRVSTWEPAPDAMRPGSQAGVTTWWR